jgi:hypothetical protein
LKQWVTPPFRVQVSVCSAFHIMCDVFCSEYVEYFPAMAFRFFKPFCYYSGGSSCHQYNHTFYVPHLLYLYINSCILVSFLLPFA